MNKTRQNRIRNASNGRAFTLVEMLLYIAIASTVIITISALLFSMIIARDRTQIILEVEENGVQIMNQITQTVRNAVSVSVPTAGNTGTSLSLTVRDSAKSPTIYNLTSNILQIKEGSGQSINLTSNRVLVSNLIFTNLSSPSTPGIIRIQFRLTFNNSSGRTQYNYYKDFTGSATLK